MGWSYNGHRIVAEIAQSLLKPATVTCLTDWFRLNETVDLASIAAHPDMFNRYNSTFKAMHFLNIDGKPVGGTYAVNDKNCPDRNCVIGACQYFQELFIDSSNNHQVSLPTSPSVLSFLVHFIGDLHQPLHVSYGVDYGGNSVNTSFFGRYYSLHSLWDGGVINRWVFEQTGRECGYPFPECDWRPMAKLLSQTIGTMPVKAWQQFTYLAAGAESFDIVNGVCYQFLKDQPGVKIPSIDRYYPKFLSLVEQRLMMAGARLAAVLDQYACLTSKRQRN